MKKVFILAITLALCLTVAFGLAACNNKKDWDYIESKGEMIIGYTVFNPMNYSEGGVLTGFDTELAQAVCEELGVKANFQVINWDNKFIELNSKNIDCIWNGFTVSVERMTSTDFSVAYMRNKQIAVIRAADISKYTNLESMANARMVAETKSTGESAIQKDSVLKNNTYIGVEKQTDALIEVKSGESDIAIVDLIMAEGTLKSNEYNGELVIVEGVALTEEDYAIGFRKNSPQTLEKVNEVLKKLYDNGTIERLAKKYNITELVKPIA